MLFKPYTFLALLASIAALALPPNTNGFKKPNVSGQFLCTEVLPAKPGVQPKIIYYHFTMWDMLFLIKKIDAKVNPKIGGTWTISHWLLDYEKKAEHLAKLRFSLSPTKDGKLNPVVSSLSTAV